jgi:hypothetical protein
MTSNEFGFDTANTKAQTSFDPLPDGWYAMRISKAEKVMGKTEATGEMLKLTFEIDENKAPQFAGRRVFTNFCLHHENQQTREISRGQVAAILESIGKKGATTLDVLLGAELQVKVKAKPAQNGYDASNEARGFRALGASTAAPAAANVAAPAAGSAPRAPWKR